MVKKIDVMKLISQNKINIIIKNIKQISLDKPIHLQYYLIHYAGYLNRLDLLIAILKHNNKWDYKNEEGMTIAHIASLNGFCDLIKYLFDKYNEEIFTILDNNNNNIIHYLVYFPNCLELLKKSNLKKYINQINIHNNTPLSICLSNLSDLVDKKIIKSPNTFRQLNHVQTIPKYNSSNIFIESIKFLLNNGADLNIKISRPPLLIACEYNMIDIIKLFFEYKCDVNILDEDGKCGLGSAIYNSNFELVKLLVENGAHVNQYMTLGQFYLPIMCLIYSTDKIIDYILDQDIDYNFKDYENNTLGHIVLINWQEYTLSTIRKILTNTKYFNIPNLNGDTITTLLFRLPFDNLIKLQTIIIKRKLDIYHKNGENMSADDYINQSNNKELIRNMIKNNISEEESSDIEIEEYDYANYNLFKNFQFDIWLTLIIILKRNNDLTIPIIDKNELFDANKYIFKDLTIEKFKRNTINKSYKNLLYFFPELLTVDIIWFNKEYNTFTEHHIKAFKLALKRKERFIIFTIGFYFHDNKNGHANIIIYDKKQNIMERFDPEGILLYENIDEFDNFMKLKFKKVKYISSNDYGIINSFQKLSDEINELKRKTGDVKGFCQAWVYWYLEMRILNKDVHPLKLVPKLLSSLIRNNTNMSIIEYIRNYANNIRSELAKYIIDNDVPEKYLNNEMYPIEVYQILSVKFINDVKKIIYGL